MRERREAGEEREREQRWERADKVQRGVAMEAELSADCARQLDEVRRWFGSLPRGAAEMDIGTLREYGVTTVKVRPLLEPDAAVFEVSFLEDGFHVYAGREGEWREIPCSHSPVDYCRAIASGGLTDIEHLWRGRAVSARTGLRLPDGVDGVTGHDLPGCFLAILRRAAGGREERVTRYAPYC